LLTHAPRLPPRNQHFFGISFAWDPGAIIGRENEKASPRIILERLDEILNCKS
jgi:hypothetical protein